MLIFKTQKQSHTISSLIIFKCFSFFTSPCLNVKFFQKFRKFQINKIYGTPKKNNKKICTLQQSIFSYIRKYSNTSLEILANIISMARKPSPEWQGS